ncbi:MAG: transcription antitermination factor NusB [Geminicoccaceae bacterium]|nr:transcription antitermination factor NusB [Geminicoccaceae bacterium]
MARKRKTAAPVLKKRRAARMAAVQALYQIEQNGQRAAQVVVEFRNHRLESLLQPFMPDVPAIDVDTPWFEIVVLGASAQRPLLDERISACLQPGWTLERCGYLLRACLRAGAFELAGRNDVPTDVIIAEYVEVARLFLGGDEPRFVHAILDRLTPTLRPRPEEAGDTPEEDMSADGDHAQAATEAGPDA